MNGDPLWLGALGTTGYLTNTIGYAGPQPLRLEADVPFTISVYGLGTDWSFWYAPAFAP
jgi:hypothetical protein